ncbi:MAG: hypothetical protein ACI9FD_001787, partial [Gammaproteobacteria bacterium]
QFLGSISYSAEQITWIRNIVHAGLLLPWIIFVKERGALSGFFL